MIPNKEQNTLKGSVEIILRDQSGKIVERRQHNNLITSSGKVLLANIFRGMEKQGVSHIGVGTNATKPIPADDGLGEELLPRKEFDQNIIQEETNASLILKNRKGKDVIKLTSKISGEKGNNIAVEVKFRSARRVADQKADLIITYMEDDTQEYFDNLVMDPESENYLIAKLNEESDFVSAAAIEEGLPEDMARQPLTGGSDITVTLSSTFGYKDSNGNLTEAGIFNSDNGGVMYNRVVFPEITKTDKLTLSLIWKISF
jgi:hypothetical protein